eukprot:3378111-Alexandrium_andersonii.AAC.1
MDQSATAVCPQGETPLSSSRNRRKSATPPIRTLGARGAARGTAPPARSAETPGSPTCTDSERGTR